MLSMRATQLIVRSSATARGLEAQKLDRAQLAAPGVREDVAEIVEGLTAHHDVDADVLGGAAQRDDRSVGASEAVVAANTPVHVADAVDAHVDLSKQIGNADQCVQVLHLATRGQVGNQAAVAGMAGHVAQPGEVRALAATKREVKDAHRGQLVDGAFPIFQGLLVGSTFGRGAGVAALAGVRAAIRELQVGLEGRGQRFVLVGLDRPLTLIAVTEAARVGAVDEDERARSRQMNDASEAFVAEVTQAAEV